MQTHVELNFGHPYLLLLQLLLQRRRMLMQSAKFVDFLLILSSDFNVLRVCFVLFRKLKTQISFCASDGGAEPSRKRHEPYHASLHHPDGWMRISDLCKRRRCDVEVVEFEYHRNMVQIRQPDHMMRKVLIDLFYATFATWL